MRIGSRDGTLVEWTYGTVAPCFLESFAATVVASYPAFSVDNLNFPAQELDAAVIQCFVSLGHEMTCFLQKTGDSGRDG